MTAKKSFGGYYELQLSAGEEYYPSLIKLNTARNALEYILTIKDYTLVYLPYYTCEVLLEPMQKLGIKYKRYLIDENLDPIIDFEIGPTECLVYTNYFGIKQTTVNKLGQEIENLIIDNAQAFFSNPLPEIDTIYSCRKFFGVPDGAYLQTNSQVRLNLNQDVSLKRFSHLIKTIDLCKEEGYEDFIENDKSLVGNNMMKMSSLTQKILSGINYEECEKDRNLNFTFLHNFLAQYNELDFAIPLLNGPMVYPLVLPAVGIRQKLIQQKIFVATYWPNVFNWTTKNMFENYLAEHLVALPIDHRYNLDDMEHILATVKKIL